MAASLSFAKLIATPTETAWSQVYHAGNLFALVSLTSPEERDLNALGKEMFNAFESNFFSLEKKNLHTITEVLDESLKDIPLSIEVSACIAFSKDAVLYLFLIGNGMILMKRGDKIGAILSEKHTDNLRKPITSSGYLNHEDVVLMMTGSFQKLVPYETIEEALDTHLPNDIIEKLTSNKIELSGDASCLTLRYLGATSPDALTPAQQMRRAMQEASPLATDNEGDVLEDDGEKEKQSEEKDKHKAPPEKHAEEEPEEEEKTLDEIIHEEEQYKQPMHNDEPDEHEKKPPVTTHYVTHHHKESAGDEHESPIKVTKGLPMPHLIPKLKIPSRKAVIGLIALLLLALLIFSILFTKQQTRSNESHAVYEQAYTEASKKYEEAEGLKNLNASLAQDDYKQAAQIITSALQKIDKGTDEEQSLRELLAKIEQNIIRADGEEVSTKSVDLSDSPLLFYAVEKSSTWVAANDGKEYALTSSTITEGKDTIIENDGDWKNVAGLGAYNGNVYVLDKNEGILKFTAGADGYGKSSYFSGDTPNLSKAVSMGIDGSIYILFSDGSIKKYTRGKEESFSVSELPSPLNTPKQLITNTDMDSIYILDSGNSRIVKLNKNGVFQKAWKADALSKAGLIDIPESEDKAYILSGKNLSVMDLE